MPEIVWLSVDRRSLCIAILVAGQEAKSSMLEEKFVTRDRTMKRPIL